MHTVSPVQIIQAAYTVGRLQKKIIGFLSIAWDVIRGKKPQEDFIYPRS